MERTPFSIWNRKRDGSAYNGNIIDVSKYSRRGVKSRLSSVPFPSLSLLEINRSFNLINRLDKRFKRCQRRGRIKDKIAEKDTKIELTLIGQDANKRGGYLASARPYDKKIYFDFIGTWPWVLYIPSLSPPYLTYKFTSLSGHGVRKQRPGTVTVEFSIDRGEAGGVAHVGSSLAPTWRNTAFPPDTRG